MKKNQKIQMIEIMTFAILLTTLIECTQSSPYSITTNPLLPPGNLTASPLNGTGNLTSSTACRLDLSSELFGGVSAACSSSPLSLTRCCPVLAAWLFAAHASSALAAAPPSNEHSDDDGPMVPENESQKCVDRLEESLKSKKIKWTPRVNDTCDTVLCYCGIRLHQISSLSCPVNMFNVTAAGGDGNSRNRSTVKLVKPMGGVKELERECKNASFFGCSRCLHSLQKLKGSGKGRSEKGERATKMFDRDCQLMGLTWLLAKNKSLYIPTVSAVLRAVLYSSSHAKEKEEYSYKCSPDQENMPLAVDSLQFQHMLDSASSSSSSSSPLFLAAATHVMQLLLVVILVLVGLF